MPHPLDPLAVRGPHAVGVTHQLIPDPSGAGRALPTEIWYPAEPVAPDAEEAAHPLGAPHAAHTDAVPLAEGAPFPLVAFSHGNSGLRHQSTFLTTHLASHGFVVAAPDHPGNTFFEMARLTTEDERIAVHKRARAERPRDVRCVIDHVLAGRSAAGPRWPALDAERIGVVGHSFGGWTALKTPAVDSRVRAVCGLAPASEPFVGRKAFAHGELPLPDSVAVLLVAALDDVLVDIDTSVRPLFQRLGPRAHLIGVADTDHFHFCDRVDVLHGLHEQSHRPAQTRATRPYADLVPEARMHRIVRALVTGFLAEAFARPAARAGGLAVETLHELDPALAPGMTEAPAA